MVLVSVIVPARDAAATLAACLDALAAEGVPSQNAQLLVVDDKSLDRTPAIARQRGLEVLEGVGSGPAAARNLGATRASGAILVFLDADTEPEAGWLEGMLAPFTDATIVGVKGRYYSHQRALIARFAQLEFEAKYVRLERAASVDFIDSGTCAYRRGAFLAAGGFDESFPSQSAEDVELGFRLAAHGAHFAFNSKAGVFHRHSERLTSYLVKKARYGYFRIRVYRRFPSKAMGDSYTPPTMALQIAVSGVALLLVPLAVLGVPFTLPALGTALALFAATTLPLVRRAGWRQPGLAVCVPGLAFCRAVAQGIGVVLGLFAFAAERLRR